MPNASYRHGLSLTTIQTCLPRTLVMQHNLVPQLLTIGWLVEIKASSFIFAESDALLKYTKCCDSAHYAMTVMITFYLT